MKKLFVALAAVVTISGAPVFAQSMEQRSHNQERRIVQGERSGQLTPREAGRLQRQQVKMHRTEQRMRWRSGGRLTPMQRERLHVMQRRDSNRIYRLKHNGRRY